jgi:hypothetical protein
LPPALAGRGVLASAGLAEHSALLAGGDVAVSDPPDHRIHTAAGLWAYRGALHGKVALEHPFDLTDSDGAELLDGESFWAAIRLEHDPSGTCSRLGRTSASRIHRRLL